MSDERQDKREGVPFQQMRLLVLLMEAIKNGDRKRIKQITAEAAEFGYIMPMDDEKLI